MTEPEAFLGTLFALLLKGEEQECERLLSTISNNELNQVRSLASQLRTVSADASRARKARRD